MVQIQIFQLYRQFTLPEMYTHFIAEYVVM